MPPQLKGNTALVTGGSRGIGKAIAEMLLKEGCTVLITARDYRELEEAQKDLEKHGTVQTITADVAKADDNRRVMQQVKATFGQLDILVNNAGILRYGPLKEQSQEEIAAVLDINLKGLISLTRELLPVVDHSEDSRIINISSGLGKVGIANFAVYCASKFGILGFTQALAEELRHARTYAVCPKMTDTKMIREFYDGPGEGIDRPEDVARVVLGVCLPSCTEPSGSSLDV